MQISLLVHGIPVLKVLIVNHLVIMFPALPCCLPGESRGALSTLNPGHLISDIFSISQADMRTALNLREEGPLSTFNHDISLVAGHQVHGVHLTFLVERH